MGAIISIIGCFICRPMEKQMKVKKALIRAIIKAIRCFMCNRVEKLRKIKKDLIWAIISLMRSFIFSPVERLRKIKKDLTGVIVSVIRWFISRLMKKPRKIKEDEGFLEEIDPKESKVVVETVEKSRKKVINMEMEEEQIHSEKPVEKKQEGCLLELHSMKPTGNKQDICLLEELLSEEPTENTEEKEQEGMIHVVAEEERGSERSPDGVLIPHTSLNSFRISISTDASHDQNDVESEVGQDYQTNSSTSQEVLIFKQEIEVFSLNIELNNSEFVEGKKGDAHSLEEQHSQEPIENVEEREQGVTEGVVTEERWINHYSSFQKILLVGEADFSFSASLAMAFGSASNMIATSLESKAFLRKKYGRVKTNIKNLTCRGCRVLHGVDATKMASQGPLKAMLFDRIIFNFPLAGFFPKEKRESKLRLQKQLVTLFLENAREMINETGEIHITYKSNGFHCERNMDQLASHHGLRLIEALPFNSTDYPDYSPKGWFGGDDNLDCYPSHTCKFGLQNAKNASTKRRRRGGRKKNNSMPIGKRLDSDLQEGLHSEEPIEHVEEREHEVIIGVVAEEERGSDRSHDGVLIPHTCLDSFINLRSTHTSHGQNDIEFEECEDYQNHSSNSGSLQQQVFVSSDHFLSCEDPISHATFQQDLEASGLDALIKSNKFVEENKQCTCLPEETHSQEPIEKRQDECLLPELHSKEPVENVEEKEQGVIKGVVAEERWINHYNSFQNILLVGEADFSFSASLAMAFGSASNMIATSLESKAFLGKNYGSAKTNIKNLTRRGCRVMHDVDATKMASKGMLKGMTFDRIKFNFPLAGFFPKERRESQLRRHQRLVTLFLENAQMMINETGEIHITHKTNGLGSEWNIEQLASFLGLRLIEAMHFTCVDYPGYSTTGFAGGDDNLDCNPSQAYKFGLENANNASRERRSRRRRKKKNVEPIGSRLDAYLLTELHSEEPIESVEERAHEVILGMVAEKERGSDRSHDGVLIPHTCLNSFINSRSTDTSHDQNDIEFEECEDYQNHSSTSGSLQQEVFVSSDDYLSCEDPILDDTLQQDLEVSDLDALIKSNECVKGKKQYTCLTEEKHSQEPIEMKREECSLLDLHSEEPLKKKQDECYLLEMNSEESFENEQSPCLVKELQLDGQIEKEGACFLDGIHSKERSENVEEREQAVIKSVVVEERWINHYSSFQKILLVGEGDFSFSASLALAFGSASNMIATSLNSKAFLMKNYGCVRENIKNLTMRGCKVLHGVDATKMASNRPLKGMTFDRIIFNFPFAGFFKKEDCESQLRRHQQLVNLFLENAKKMINETGEIHITHKTNGFHHKWTIKHLASAQGLRFIEAACFLKSNYPGYRTKCGFGGDNDFNCNPSKTYKFGLQNALKMNKKKEKKEKKEKKKKKTQN